VTISVPDKEISALLGWHLRLRSKQDVLKYLCFIAKPQPNASSRTVL
jgi:hypothetical protein